MRKLFSFLFIICLVSVAAAQTISGNTSFCQGGSTILTVTGGSAPYQWQRSTDGGINWTSITGATAVSYTVTTPGSYRAMVGGSPTALVDVVMNPNPVS